MNNRIYKFRAWDKENRLMVYSDDNLKGTGRCNLEWFFSIAGDSYLLIMQYTGLRDKNGNEIYEGDIIKGRYKKLSIIDDIRYVIIGSDECETKWEVLGNVYENPELIE